MGDMVGSTSKSRLTEKTLGRIEARAAEINTQAMVKMLDEMGHDTKVSAGDFGRMWLLAYQAALLEEQVADIKTIKNTKEV